jgi:hypothetical protein
MLAADNTTSLTGLILVAVVSGALGAFLSTFWQTRHERKERMRERLIVVVHDLATGVTQAMMPLPNLFDSDVADEQQQQFMAHAAATEVRRGTDEAMAQLPLVELLFGVGSSTTKAARETVSALSKAALEAEKPQPRLMNLRDLSHLTGVKLNDLIRAAHKRVA